MGILFLTISVALTPYVFYLFYQRYKGIVKNIPFTNIDGINQLAKGIDVKISFMENIIIIDGLMIPNSKIKKMQIQSSKQLVNKENSVIGNAIVGGILAGGVGAIVGGLSGVNDGSKVTRLMQYLIITFNDERKAIFSFKNDSNKSDLKGVIKKFNGNESKEG